MFHWLDNLDSNAKRDVFLLYSSITKLLYLSEFFHLKLMHNFLFSGGTWNCNTFDIRSGLACHCAPKWCFNTSQLCAVVDPRASKTS